MNWRSVSLGQVGTIVGGGTPSTTNSEHFGGGYPWITPKDLSRQNSRFVRAGERNITDSGLRASSAKLLPAGTVVLSSRAPIGLTAIAVVPLTTNQGCRSFVPGAEVDSLFMYYLLGSMKNEFERRANGSTFKEISGSTLSAIEILLPPIDEQRAIAATLGALDDKIESNRRAQNLAESLLRTLVESTLQESSGISGTLSDYCELVKDQVATRAIDPSDNYIGFDSMPRGQIFLDQWQVAASLASHKSRFRAGDVLFGKLRPYFKKVGIAPISGICSTDILALRPANPEDTALVAVIASSDRLIDRLSAAATGTRMPRASWADLAAWPVTILEPRERRELGQMTQPIVKKATRLTHETVLLSRLRDALLPELLSGRVRTASTVSQELEVGE